MLARADGVLTVSDADRHTFGRLYPDAVRAPMHVVPTGVDVEFFDASPSPPASKTLVFTGSMDWLPNEDAMLFFCRHVLPLIRREEPDVRLSIVGRAPTAAVTALAADAAIEVTGRVDDVRPYMRDAAVYIVPLRIGGGTRLKIFEALAMGKAVVSTGVGAEGLAVTPGRDVAIADQPEQFAQTVASLLRNPAKRHALGRAGRQLVQRRYSWEQVTGEFDQYCESVARIRPARGGTPIALATRQSSS